MALAPERHIAVFVDHYRRKGAERVRVYFDGPAGAAPTAMGSKAELIVCDEAFWAARGGRPAIVEDRQRVVYADAYSRLTADWLLVVDIDEMIFGDVDPAAVLGAVPPQREAVIFPTVEAVWRAGDDLSREYGATLARKSYNGPFPDLFGALAYPRRGTFFVRGLLAHHMGKHAVRRGLTDILVCLHESKRDDRPLKAARARDPKTGRTAWLLHHDAINLDAWRAKWDLRLARSDTAEMGRRRRRQQAAYANAREAGEESALFARLYGLTRLQAGVLRRLGMLLDIVPAGRRSDRLTCRPGGHTAYVLHITRVPSGFWHDPQPDPRHRRRPARQGAGAGGHETDQRQRDGARFWRTGRSGKRTRRGDRGAAETGPREQGSDGGLATAAGKRPTAGNPGLIASTEVFLDTNVLLYAAMGSVDDSGQETSGLIKLSDLPGSGTSGQVLAEFYVNAQRKGRAPLTAEAAKEWVVRLSKKAFQPVDFNVIRAGIEASRRYQISYWDGAIIAAAERLGAKVLYSEDLNHGQTYGSVRVENPFLSA